MKTLMKQKQHKLFCLLLAGFLLCFFLPIIGFAQSEVHMGEMGEPLPIEDSDSINPPVEIEYTGDSHEDLDMDTENPSLQPEELAELPSTDNDENLINAVSSDVQEIMWMPDVINDVNELKTWLTHNQAGGTVTLGGNIEVTDYLPLEQIHIEAGDFGFIVTGQLAIHDDTHIIGSGSSAPLIRIDAGGTLLLSGTNSISAVGENGTSLFLADGSNYSSNLSAYPLFYAEGTDAVAIHSEIPLHLKYHTIQATNGARLIENSQPVYLYLSHLAADESVSLPSHITLDTCMVSPSVSGGTVISRKLTNLTSVTTYFFAAGENDMGFFNNNKIPCYLTLSAEGVEDNVEAVMIMLDDGNVDYNEPNEYLLPCILPPPYEDFYDLDIILDACPLALAITVYDPDVPYFYNYVIRRGVIVISYKFSGDFDTLTLWRSDDDGENWQIYWQPDYEESETFQVDHDGYSFDLLFFDPDEFSSPALLVLEVGQGMGSDILCVDVAAIANRGNGGDRDSGDRILLPWELFSGNPTPEDEESKEPSGGGRQTSTNLLKKSSQGTPPDAEPVMHIPPDLVDTPTTRSASEDANPDSGEYENETTIAVSGNRLKALMQANPQMVPFARQNIQVWIPSSFLANLQLTDTDIFTVIMEKPTQTSISLLFYVNGNALSQQFAEPCLVTMPWTETDGEFVCMDSDGRPIPFEYDSQNDLLLLTLDKCGTYTIRSAFVTTDHVISGGTDPVIDDGANHVIDGGANHVIGITTNGMIGDSSRAAAVTPISEQTSASSSVFPMLVVGLAGTGGAGGLFYAFRKRR